MTIFHWLPTYLMDFFCWPISPHRNRVSFRLLLHLMFAWGLFLFSLAGISRSVTMSAAYIISVTGLSVAEALQAVRSSRTIANPNFGFQKQLHDFEVNGGAQKVSQTPYPESCGKYCHRYRIPCRIASRGKKCTTKYERWPIFSLIFLVCKEV